MRLGRDCVQMSFACAEQLQARDVIAAAWCDRCRLVHEMGMEMAGSLAQPITDDKRPGELVEQQRVGGSHQIAKKRGAPPGNPAGCTTGARPEDAWHRQQRKRNVVHDGRDLVVQRASFQVARLFQRNDIECEASPLQAEAPVQRRSRMSGDSNSG